MNGLVTSLAGTQDGPLLGVAALALITGALAVWRGTRAWLALAVAFAVVDIALAWLVARALERHTEPTRLAMGAGLVALIALVIRFGLGAVTSKLVPDGRPGDHDPR
jgi:hypothetical protein